jgi:hypothetical protein
MHNRLVCIRKQLVPVIVLEDLVETVFASALEGVAYERGGPAEEYTAESFFLEDGGPGGEVGFVDVGVDLATAFYKVEGCYGGVCRTACWRCV